mmetsp:Transcript_1262/g.2615  ORF Transcript_1262/g.2615 Transcript_1262/m.2615 type:complete len:92 (+) Transcript_1262:256-531(+)|eukprot:CAMPEP_0114224520 /NCGR_PEP_ID=MMETSP0058-20121206/153_1 /TAXON_ID=36894 /ORGANISM="Pyramimonas parkeae, CCMP726" /LENGTH=91 /DNA_ID=CAMNT_0001335005 /DNA_START=353 /DNA_END=628 /DNA_ORIENTATION=+
MFLHASYTARNLVKTVVSAGAVMAGGLGATILGSEAAFMMQGGRVSNREDMKSRKFPDTGPLVVSRKFDFEDFASKSFDTLLEIVDDEKKQ